MDLTLSREGTPHIVAASAAVQNQFFFVNGLGLVLLNLLTCGWHLTGSDLLNSSIYGVALLLIAYSIYVGLAAREDCGFYKPILVLASILVGASWLTNFGNFSIGDSLKYLSMYTFYIAGRSIAARSAPGSFRPAEKRCIYALAFLPFIFMLIGQTQIYVSAEFPDVFSYFPNTNTAALYFCAILFSLSQWLGTKTLLLQLINAALMNRVGPIVATILAISIWSLFPLRRQVFVALAALGIACVPAYALGAFDRLLTGVSNIVLIWSLDPATAARMTYKQLFELTGTSDLSAFFRIIHWTNIWEIYSTQGLGVIVFGYGAGQTMSLTYMPVPPHNDYLRILAEYGFLSLLVFAFFVFSILFSIKLHAAKILFTVLLIYFFSENLIDNFTSMALFFSYAGRFTSGRSSGSGYA